MDNLKKRIDKLFPEIVKLRREIHENPELGMQETATTNLIKETLISYGVEIEEHELDSGVIGIIRGAYLGKTIALRADIDALPMKETSGLPFKSKNEGVCHSCGHDLHTAYLLLVAKILQEDANKLAGNIRLIFQPAEELGSGAKHLVKKGVSAWTPSMDEIIGVHVATELPVGSIGLIKGPASAGCDQIFVKVKGHGGHGAHPSRCVDPIVIAAFLIGQLQTLVSRETSPFAPVVLTFGQISGGHAPNVIPETVSFSGTLRTFDNTVRKQLKEAIKRTCELHCQSMRAEAEVTIEEGIPPLLHDGKIVDDLEKAANEVLGAEQIVKLSLPNSSSDDFSVYLDYCPGVRYRIGSSTSVPATKLGAHNPGVIFDEEAIRVAALVTCQYIYNALKKS